LQGFGAIWTGEGEGISPTAYSNACICGNSKQRYKIVDLDAEDKVTNTLHSIHTYMYNTLAQ